MNQYNNKDLYQILGVNKNASQEQIIKVSQELVPKNSSGSVQISQEIGEAMTTHRLVASRRIRPCGGAE